MPLSDDEILKEKNKASQEVANILTKLEKDYPGTTEGVATAVGAAAGGAGSLAALFFGGKVIGLSAAGISSGLGAAGAIVGGGMAAGIGVLAAPVAILGVAGYALAKKHKNAKLATALATAIGKLYDILGRLQENAEYYKEEIAEIKATIGVLQKKTPN